MSDIGEVLKKAREVGEARKRFWNLLVATVKRAGYLPPQGRQTVVLNLGCGQCVEGMVLNAFFGGGRFGFENNRVRVIGVDISKKSIESAIEMHKTADFSERITKYYLPKNYEFIVGDATNLDAIETIPEQVDVVVIRHQQISADRKIWRAIVLQALKRVSPDGIVLITSFSDIEHEMLEDELKSMNCKIVINERNEFARVAGHKEVSIDRKIFIIKRINTAYIEKNTEVNTGI